MGGGGLVKDARPGPSNTIGDVAGLRVGHAEDRVAKTGVTVLVADAPFTASVDVRGGAPGTTETDLLAPGATVARVDALVLSGGSALGLASVAGVVEGLRQRERGFVVGPVRVPVVPGAILFDLLNGGRKPWDEPDGSTDEAVAPHGFYAALGRAALDHAFSGTHTDVGTPPLGTVGAGTGATTADCKGGLGSASLLVPCERDEPFTVGALVAVNAVGSVLAGNGPHFLAGAHERRGTDGREGTDEFEFGGLGPGRGLPGRIKGRAADGTAQHGNTTIGIVATNAPLGKAECARLAVAAQAGLARAIWPAHTPLDGDVVFGVSTGGMGGDSEGGTGPSLDPDTMLDLAAAAGDCMARAIARGVYEARSEPGDLVPTWRERFGRG